MAQLSSPGVSVTVIDESFYTPAAPGTVPLIVVATQANKMNSAGTGTAKGTLSANAGTVYLLTSQMDLGNTFGIPYFQTDASNNPVHAGEVNEYGLQTAYSFLGVANRAYVVRADIDLAQLEGSATPPAGVPTDGTYWFDVADTAFGVFQWNASPATAVGGQSFTNRVPTVITNVAYLVSQTAGNGPAASFGSIGDYAITATTTLNKLWYKKGLTDTAAGTWVEVGDTTWKKSIPTATGTIASPTLLIGDSIVINSSTVTGQTTVSGLATAINSAAIAGVTAAAINGYLNLYSTGVDIVISGTTVAKVGLTVGTYLAPALNIAPHYTVPTYGKFDNVSSVNGYPTGSLWIKTTPVNLGANWDIKVYNSETSTWISQSVSALYASNQAANAALDPTGGGINIPVGQVYVKYNDDEATPVLAHFKTYKRVVTGATASTSNIITSSTFPAGAASFTIAWSTVGSGSLTSAVTVGFTATGATSDSALLAAAFTAAITDNNIDIAINANNSVTITHQAGGDIRLVDGTGTPIVKLFTIGTASNFYADPTGNASKYVITAWASTVGGTAVAPASFTAPVTTPANGTLWYNTDINDIDIMVNDGTHWVGYLNYVQNGAGGTPTDPAGPIISATKPTVQSDGTPLANGDIWINSSDLENWPELYKYNYTSKTWVLVDNTDQTTSNGIVFADARWSATGTSSSPASIVTLLSTNYVDGDSPNPSLYPKGTLLYNLRRSGNNVLKYVKNHVDVNAYNTRYQNTLQTGYYTDTWVSDAPNDYLGVGQFGRHAQRAVVVQALNALIQSNQQIRDEDSRVFDIISCPGYLETLPSLVGLNTDRGLLSFIIADTPARLSPDATSLSNWGSNTANATGDGEHGLVTTDANTAIYYPWGYTTDLLGNNIVVPPSHIMLRTIALSDNVSFPWFAPAGVRRGGVTNASSVGYVDSATGEFTTVALNTGQRDTLAAVHINPITYIGGVGLVAYGQKTRQLIASSLDRINVARLVIYLRYKLNAIAKPYIFEPNDTITRNEIKNQIEAMLLDLTGQRALYDYLVVCDTSNNTPSRIDANELHVDIAIEPVKAVEFIYIPLRLENTGAIKGLGA